MIADLKKNAEQRMRKSVEALAQELSRLRTGRAHPSLLEPIEVDYYGNKTPLKQVANVTVEDARTLLVTPWDKSMIGAIEKAILVADLGLNPVTAGLVMRIPMPPLTESRRKEMVKMVKHEGENAKVAIRNIRRDANNDLKEALKAKSITEDDDRRGQDDIQKLTDKLIGEVDAVLAKKEQELMEV
ncbi:MAG: ribosome recycling factor [Gammaproteobacteria bacterium]|nr:ribosome recycling factor [Gammaproteobacteria bacterium]